MSTLAYVTVPKILNTDQTYKKLSVEARYLYCHMRDTLKLSIKNNWQDEHGFFIKMKRTTIAELLNKSVPTVRKIVKELVKIGLVKERRVGLTQANRFYIQYLPGESDTDFISRKKAEEPSREKQGFSPDGKGFSPNNPNTKKHNNSDTNNTLSSEKKDWKMIIKEGLKWFDHKTGKYWQCIEGNVVPLVFGDELKKATSELLQELGMSKDEAIRLSY